LAGYRKIPNFLPLFQSSKTVGRRRDFLSSRIKLRLAVFVGLFLFVTVLGFVAARWKAVADRHQNEGHDKFFLINETAGNSS
jgi:hypothetical protein